MDINNEFLAKRLTARVREECEKAGINLDWLSAKDHEDYIRNGLNGEFSQEEINGLLGFDTQ